jgi:hypothetical protein
MHQGRVFSVHGMRMTAGIDPAGAAAAFLHQHGRIFGVGQPELAERWVNGPKDETFTVFAYRQTLRGVPVDGGEARVMVWHRPVAQVGYASAVLAGEPIVGANPPVVPALLASVIAQTRPGYGQLAVVGEPEFVVLRGEGTRGDAWTWRVRVQRTDTRLPEPRTFFIETLSGELIHVRNEFAHSGGVTGTVSGWGSTLGSTLPHPVNPPSLLRLPDVRVEAWLPGAFHVLFADDEGEFTISAPDDETALLEMRLGPDEPDAGRYIRVIDVRGDLASGACAPEVQTALVAYGSATAPAHIDLQIPDTNDPLEREFAVAQVNAVVHAHRSRQLFASRLISPVLEGQLRMVVNSIFEGNAGYTICAGQPTLWFGGNLHVFDRSNFASASIIAHEYGHYAIRVLATPGTPHFDEGYADSLSILLNDDGVIGRFHLNNNTVHVRNDPLLANCQYPIPNPAPSPCVCNDEYAVGQMLSGVWVRILAGLKQQHGQTAGLERARQLFVDWTLITLGGQEACHSAWHGTACEVLGVTQGLIDLDIVHQAFAAHGLGCIN